MLDGVCAMTKFLNLIAAEPDIALSCYMILQNGKSSEAG